MENLPLDVFHVIGEYLYPKDIMSLRIADKRFSFLKHDTQIRKIILRHLKEFTSHPEKLLDAIDKSGYVLSGSFLLNCLTGDDWEVGDIDLYQDVENYEDWKESHEGKHKEFYSSIYKIGLNTFKRILGEVLSSRILAFQEKGKKKITIIRVANVDPIKMIRLSFDTDICKNAYKNGKLLVKDWAKQVAMRDYILPCTFLTVALDYYGKLACAEIAVVEKTEKRQRAIQRGQYPKEIIKYICPTEEFIQEMIVEKIRPKMMERIKKYKQRNYTLTEYPDSLYIDNFLKFLRTIPEPNCQISIFQMLIENKIDLEQFSTDKYLSMII